MSGYKTKWCEFVWRSHGCRHGASCRHAHTWDDYLGPPDTLLCISSDKMDPDTYRIPNYAYTEPLWKTGADAWTDYSVRDTGQMLDADALNHAPVFLVFAGSRSFYL